MANPEISDGLVLFGGGGDLSLRMLFPALAWLEAEGLLPAGMPIVAAARSPMDEAAFRMLARTSYVAVDVTHPDELKLLGERMAALNIARPLYYLSVSPSLYSAICQ